MIDLKERLIKTIQQTTDQDVLEEVYRLLEINFDDQTIYNLSQEQKKAVKESQEQIIETLKSDKEVWVHYEFMNPETDKKEPKTSLFKMYDNLIFGSGFYE